MTAINKTRALKIARHLHGRLFPFGRDQYAYNYACGPRQITTSHARDFFAAQSERKRSIEEMVDLLINGGYDGSPAPEWMTEEFKW